MVAVNPSRADASRTRWYEYEPYGERTVYISPGSNDPDCHAPTLLPTRVQVSGIDQPYGICDVGFQGKQHCDVSRLIAQGRRWLHPRFGNFISRDILHYPDGLNAYAAYFVMWGMNDPTGLSPATPNRWGRVDGPRVFQPYFTSKTPWKANAQNPAGRLQHDYQFAEGVMEIAIQQVNGGANPLVDIKFFPGFKQSTKGGVECECKSIKLVQIVRESDMNFLDHRSGWQNTKKIPAKVITPNGWFIDQHYKTTPEGRYKSPYLSDYKYHPTNQNGQGIANGNYTVAQITDKPGYSLAGNGTGMMYVIQGNSIVRSNVGNAPDFLIDFVTCAECTDDGRILGCISWQVYAKDGLLGFEAAGLVNAPAEITSAKALFTEYTRRKTFIGAP